MRLYYSLLLTLFLIGCGNAQNLDNPTISDGSRQFDDSSPTFESLKNDFTTEGNSLSVFPDLDDIPINFGDLDNIPGLSLTYQELGHSHDESCIHKTTQNASYHFVSVSETSFATTVGVCIEYSNGDAEILIRESSWNSFSSAQKEILIFHELGHCSLDRDHVDDEYKGLDLSVMNSLLIDQFDYQDYYDEYIEELFLQDDASLRNAINIDFP